MFVFSKIGWFLCTPSNILAVLVTGGVMLACLGRWRRQSMMAAAAGAIGLLVCGFSPLALWLTAALETRFPAPNPMPAQITGIIVLGGGIRLQGSVLRDTLSLSEAGDRLLALADLARRYPTARIVVSGASGDLFSEGAAEADLVREHAHMLSVDPARILVEDRSRNTYENAEYTSAMLKPEPGQTWLLVTSAWHMPRAVGAFRRAGFSVIAYPVDFRATSPWWPFSEVAAGLGATDLVAKELLGILAYWLMGRTDALLPSPDPP
jgi:uncharacterized SAM-binding protein YcdF (DUF218 family)